jgi:hypothetical protein
VWLRECCRVYSGNGGTECGKGSAAEYTYSGNGGTECGKGSAAGYIVGMVEQHVAKEVLQHIIHSK